MTMVAPLARLVGPSVVVATIWLTLFWWPATGARSDAVADRDTALTTLLEHQTELAIARRDPVDEAELLADLASSTAAVPEEADLAGVVDLLHDTARGHSVQLTQVVPGRVITRIEDPGLPPGIGAIEIAITASGPFGATLAFVDELTATDRLLVMTELELISREVGTDDVQATIELRAYTSGITVDEGEVGIDPATLNRGNS